VGHWAEVTTVAKPGSYCGGANLLVINDRPEDGTNGRWHKILVPEPPKV
jgi:hypothetical protein